MTTWTGPRKRVRDEVIPLDQREHIERFEDAWQGEHAPDLREFLVDVSKSAAIQKSPLMIELVAIDMEYRWRHSSTAGDAEIGSLPMQPTLEDYVREGFFKSSTDIPLDLITEEYRVRQLYGDQPAHTEYLQRYASQASDLSVVLKEADELLRRENDLGQRTPGGEDTCSFTAARSDKDDGRTLPITNKPYAGELDSKIPGYEVLAEIARGGMGVVYKARQTRANRVVALKLILAGNLATQEDIQRFYTEAKAAANLEHPNVVPVYDVGEHDGQHFYSMGFVEGQSLAERLRDGPLEPREAADVIRAVCEAVAYAHERGIVHRDLKPANVLIDANGQPKVTDFGLAKNNLDDTGITVTGQLVGTPTFMSPEQARGDIAQAGPLADVYSLGATLYALLTGRPPFLAASLADTLHQVLNQEPVTPRQINPAIDNDLATICLKCLEKEPERRYGSAAELAEELGRYLNGVPILARPVSRAERCRRWCRRQPVLAGFVFASVALLLTMFVVVTASYFSVSSALSATESARETADQQRKEANNARIAESSERVRADGERDEALRQLELQRRSAYNLQLQRIAEEVEFDETSALEMLRNEQICPPGFRDFTWGYLNRLAQRENHVLYDNSAPSLLHAIANSIVKVESGGRRIGTMVSLVAFSPDGMRMASFEHDVIRQWDLENRSQTWNLSAINHSLGISYSPDGELLATLVDGSVRLISTDTRRTVATHSVEGAKLVDVAISPDVDNPFIAASTTDGRIVVWSKDGDEPLRQWQASLYVARPSSPNRAQQFTAPIPNSIDGESTTQVFNRFVVGGVRTQLVFTYDGNHIVSGGDDGRLLMWDVATGKLETVLFQGGKITQLSVSKLGVAWFEQNVGIHYLSLQNPTDKSTVHDGPIIPLLGLSPNGNTLAYRGSAGEILLWDVQRRRVTRVLRLPLSALPAESIPSLRISDYAETHTLAFSPDGRWLAQGSTGPVVLWSMGPQEFTVDLHGHDGWVMDLSVAPNGKWFATASQDSTVQVTSIEGDILNTLAHPGPVRAVAFSPRGTLLATGCVDGKIRLYSTTDWHLERTIAAHKPGVQFGVESIAFSPSGEFIASTGSDRLIHVRNADTGEAIVSRRFAKNCHELQFTPNGDVVAFAGPGPFIGFWNWKKDELRQSDPIQESNGRELDVERLAMSTDGETVAVVTGSRRTIHLVDVSTGKTNRRLTGRSNSVLLDFSFARQPDGKDILAAVDMSGMLKIWDPVTGQERFSARRHVGPARCVAFFPDGQTLVTSGDDKTLRLWGTSDSRARASRQPVEEAYSFLRQATRPAERLGELIEKIEQLDPETKNRQQAWKSLAELRLLSGKPSGALNAVKSSVENRGKIDVDHIALFAAAYYQSGMSLEAKSFAMWLPGNVEDPHLHALALPVRQSLPEGASATHEDSAWWVSYARHEAASGRDVLTLQALLRALALDPNSSEAHFELGATRTRQKRWDLAIASFKTSALLEPEEARIYLALAAAASQNQDTALAYMENAASLSESWPTLGSTFPLEGPQRWDHLNNLFAFFYRVRDRKGSLEQQRLMIGQVITLFEVVINESKPDAKVCLRLVNAYDQLTMVQRKRGETDEAVLVTLNKMLATWRQAIDVATDIDIVRNVTRAVLLRFASRPDVDWQLLAGCADDPTRKNAYTSVLQAIAQLRIGKHVSAKQLLEETLGGKHDFDVTIEAFAWAFLGLAHFESKAIKPAQEAYAKGWQLLADRDSSRDSPMFTWTSDRLFREVALKLGISFKSPLVE